MIKKGGNEMLNPEISRIDVLSLHKDLFYTTKSILFELEQIWVPFLKQYDLTLAQINILYQLTQVEKSSISELARFGYMHISSAQNCTKKLCNRGLLKIEKAKTDSRITNVYLTQEGLKFIESMQNNLPDMDLVSNRNTKEDINHLVVLLLQNI